MSATQTEKQQITDWLASSQPDMLALLERLVNIDSWSYDKAGVDKVGEEIAAFLGEPRHRCDAHSGRDARRFVSRVSWRGRG